MCSTEANGSIANAWRDTLSVIFATMDADYYQFRFIPLFELPQLREYMDAVDSTIGPEIEQDDFPAKIGELDGPSAGMYPVDVVGKFRRSYGWSGREFSWH